MTSRHLTALVLAAGLLAGCQGGAAGSGSPEPSTSSQEQGVQGFTNPVVQGNFPDPQVIRTGNGFLAIATNGNGMNVQTMTSPDMVTWTQGVDALPQLAGWSSSGKVWAPEIVQWLDGSWRLFYTTRAPDPQWQCISVAVATKPEGPYTDSSAKPLVCETKEGGSIDQSAFVDASGKAWLYWKNDGNAVQADTWIKVQQLSADGKALAGAAKKLFQQDLPWEGHLVEAPAVVEIDGLFHMFYSANDYGSADYAVGHAVADSPTGPFTKDPEPVLASNEVAAGPGHCQLLKVGGQWWMVYHAWQPDAVGDEATGRQMWLSRVTFDGRKATVEAPTVDHPRRP
ncbi:glycoside hydrolase family 43 protein [Luteococcus peritonei]|uniref:Glycoside hydrolase family 43 protein n=1 Tax=Luteococcus peritonei TaxID=88874 RepID=A0ABW4RS66_9ACTN